MGVIEMWDIKAMTIHYPYYKNVSGSQEWPNRWDKLLGPVRTASSLRVAPQSPFIPYSGYHSPGSPTCWFHKYWDNIGAEPIA